MSTVAHLNESGIYVQEEPALEFALPQGVEQPRLVHIRRKQLSNPEALIAHIYRRHRVDSKSALGQDYQRIVTEFQPFFSWLIACWDHLLSSEGCRFLPRTNENRWGIRGDFRAFTYKDYSRMIHRLFRENVLMFAQSPETPSLAQWLRVKFWPQVIDTYKKLEQPPNPRQRVLTPYSYLRCTPYEFLNTYHQELVTNKLKRMDRMTSKAIDLYFLHFYTESASAQQLGLSTDAFKNRLNQGLIQLLLNERLIYCLLRQIERY